MAGIVVVPQVGGAAGKTTAIRAMADELTASGRYAALYLSCESAEAAAGDYAATVAGVLRAIRRRAEDALPAELRPPPWPEVVDTGRLAEALSAWARRAEGRTEGRAEALVQLLTLKFGPLPPDVIQLVHSATVDQVETWTARVLTADTLGHVLP